MQRLHCAYCDTSWTVHGEGVKDGCLHSDRLRAIGVFLYMLGLSDRSVACFCGSLEWRTSKSTVERDVRDAGQNAKTLREEAPKMRMRVLGVDPTNNTMVRLIGLTYKIRTKTMRGFKSRDKAQAHPYLATFLRSTAGLCDFRMVT